VRKVITHAISEKTTRTRAHYFILSLLSGLLCVFCDQTIYIHTNVFSDDLHNDVVVTTTSACMLLLLLL